MGTKGGASDHSSRTGWNPCRLNFLKDTKSDLWGFFWFSCLTDHSPESNLFFPLLEYY